MVMRYHWGMAVGHLYGLQCSDLRDDNPSFSSDADEAFDDDFADATVHDVDDGGGETLSASMDERDSDATDSDSQDGDEDYDDPTIMAFQDMYGDSQEDEVID